MKTMGFCRKKFHSMLLTGSFTMTVVYIMLLCDNIIAGLFIGENGVAAINIVTPVTGVVTFFANLIAIGTGIVYSRYIGVMDKEGADKVYGQGLILSAVIASVSVAILLLMREAYFEVNGITGSIYALAADYYRWTPLNACLMVMVSYFNHMVYTDGDERSTNLSYGLQVVVNIVASLLLVTKFGMTGIIWGTIIGNVFGAVPLAVHFFKKSNTLRFIPHFSKRDMVDTINNSLSDSMVYLCWGVADYVMIGHVARYYGETGQVTLAVIINLLQFSIVMSGVGIAIQPLLGTYLGEKNHTMIRRLMIYATKAAVWEGLLATALVFIFAAQFCGLFGITTGEVFVDSVHAVRVVCFGLVFCSILSLASSYYRVGLGTGITFLKDGVFYTLLPLIGSVLLGKTGMWVALALSPLLALFVSGIYIYFRYGSDRFPLLLENTDTRIEVFEDTLTPAHCAELSERVGDTLRAYGYDERAATLAALFTEEIGLTVLEKNKKSNDHLLLEISIIFSEDSALLVQRDSGVIFDVTDPDLKIDGLSSFVINGLLLSKKESAYLTTTGYNRNMIRIHKNLAATTTE